MKYEDKESGIAKIEWCVENVDNMCNIQPWETVPTNVVTKSAVIHSLLTITSVRVMVRITNGVGNAVLLKSTKCNPGKTFPPKVDVIEVKNLNDTLADIDYQTDTEAIIVTWLSPSNVSSYSSIHAALTEPKEGLNITDSLLQKWRGEPFAFEFVDIPRGKTHIRFSGDRIKPYTNYRPVVRRCNEIGLCSDSVGDGVVIVPDAPPDIQVIIIISHYNHYHHHHYYHSSLLPCDGVDNSFAVCQTLSTKINLRVGEYIFRLFSPHFIFLLFT